MKGEKKKLTDKQERFCREYVLCMNKSEAYRKVYDTSKMKETTVNNLAYRLFNQGEVRARVEELKNDLEEVLGISKAEQINSLLILRDRCMRKIPVMVFNPKEKKMVQKTEKVKTADGEWVDVDVWAFDSNGANSAIDKVMKAMGYYAPEKRDITSNGETIKTVIVD